MVKNRAFGSIQRDAEKISFFKLLAYEDLASESMRLIPHEFKGSVCKNLPLKVILKVVWGRSWRVNLSKFMGSYIMERKGWEKFLNDNKLGDSEFLTFTNEGNNCLSVSIFKKNCKEIITPRETTTIASSYSKEVKEEEMSSNGPVTAECTRKGAKQKEKRAEEEEARKKSKKMKMEADSNVYRASSSSSSDATFSFTIRPSNLTLATIPQKFAAKHMPKKATKFTIQDPDGKSWEVVYFYSEAQKLFSSGWRVLARKCGLAVGDICTFKLTKPKEMVLEVLRASQMK